MLEELIQRLSQENAGCDSRISELEIQIKAANLLIDAEKAKKKALVEAANELKKSTASAAS